MHSNSPSEPYAVERPDEIYVPWGRPADQAPVPGIHADPLAEAHAALGMMVERVMFYADLQFGQIVWNVMARLRRLNETIDRIALVDHPARIAFRVGAGPLPLYEEAGGIRQYLGVDNVPSHR